MLLSLKKKKKPPSDAQAPSKFVAPVVKPKAGIEYPFKFDIKEDRLITYYDDNCYVTINYDERGQTATIQMFQCERENGKKRGGGLGKKLLYNVLKYIDKETRIIMIELIPFPVGKNSNNNESKLIKYYEKLGFEQDARGPGRMQALLKPLLIKLNPEKTTPVLNSLGTTLNLGEDDMGGTASAKVGFGKKKTKKTKNKRKKRKLKRSVKGNT